MSSLATELGESGGLREAMSCDVCSEVYEQVLKTPLVLPCGHTFCRACLTALKKSGRFLCPTCRVAHNNVQVETLSVNYSLLNILPFCNDFTHENCSTHGDDLRYWCCTCNLPLCSLCLYSGHPQGHTVKLAQSFVKEKKLELVEKINISFRKIEDQKKKLKEGFSDLNEQVKQLFCRNAQMMDRMGALSNLLAEIQKANNIASVKYFEKEVKKLQSNEEKQSISDEATAGVADSQEAAPKAVKSCSDQGEKQQSDSQSQQTQETTEVRRALIDYSDGHLLLHSLAEPISTRLSMQIPYEVFLDLSVDDKCLGRVYISLWSHLRRAQQLLALCMGTMGSTLLGAKASAKTGSTILFRYAVDGNNQTTKQALLTNLEWSGQYSKHEAEGYVIGADNVGGTDFRNSTAFGICTQSVGNVPSSTPFGTVVAGLEVAKDAFLHNPITDVTITHCGLVLPGLSS